MNILNKILLLVLVFIFASCKTMGGGMISSDSGDHHHDSVGHLPPAHAPAHGRRAQVEHHYYYYPDSTVYFDIERNVYFYLSGSNWLIRASLPKHYHLSDYRVRLKMESSKPYSRVKHHKRKYPKKHH